MTEDEVLSKACAAGRRICVLGLVLAHAKDLPTAYQLAGKLEDELGDFGLGALFDQVGPEAVGFTDDGHGLFLRSPDSGVLLEELLAEGGHPQRAFLGSAINLVWKLTKPRDAGLANWIGGVVASFWRDDSTRISSKSSPVPAEFFGKGVPR